ncbi:integrase [Micromonospora sp. NBC_00898]|uniref:integrase n=1 Tax=Micromonospora sp. NBC_00898 TaxID=2975981 RepID=UPI00386E9101|nr:integrase [Micromonospora sp. NBC_00898]
MGTHLPRRDARPNPDQEPGHLIRALREYEDFYKAHRPHQGMANARPTAPLPEPISDKDELNQLRIRRRDRLGGLLHEYEHAA